MQLVQRRDDAGAIADDPVRGGYELSRELSSVRGRGAHHAGPHGHPPRETRARRAASRRTGVWGAPVRDVARGCGSKEERERTRGRGLTGEPGSTRAKRSFYGLHYGVDKKCKIMSSQLNGRMECITHNPLSGVLQTKLPRRIYRVDRMTGKTNKNMCKSI